MSLALPPFKPQSCGCNSNKMVYATPIKWKAHCKGQRHLAFEQEYQVKLQQQLLTSRDNEILRLGVVIKEKNDEIKQVKKVANGIISELKTQLRQPDYF